ncbi:VOC family protein [Teredinibacter sp. KSP-S5-2]|uniref:VOC family protein n=1 Tax=Teredinibacter sp. KSP-S5-2 TaxID=3034506 RepID=UPI0029350762|nr:VOC family protein [Teredinibacter sp. KSP-S5-2]WNO09987.1 hypothetical protein P5V12_02260 [Teredinibacter sp. KSP-S5-2]
MNISLLVLRCTNIELSRDFYSKLGLSFIEEKHGDGPRHYSCEIDGMILELYPNKGEALQENIRLGFKVDNLESVLEQVIVASTYVYAGSAIYVITDPDGRKVELS